jgi:hypothetical protein
VNFVDCPSAGQAAADVLKGEDSGLLSGEMPHISKHRLSLIRRSSTSAAATNSIVSTKRRRSPEAVSLRPAAVRDLYAWYGRKDDNHNPAKPRRLPLATFRILWLPVFALFTYPIAFPSFNYLNLS